MNYSFDDENIDELRVGDTLTLEDGTKHIAVIDDGPEQGSCKDCSIIIPINRYRGKCGAYKTQCNVHNFHFNEV